MKFLKAATAFFTAVKYIWTRGSPFAVFSALWPPNEQGKYVIQAEGIRLALTNHGAGPTNLWINSTDGRELDIVLGLDHTDVYPRLKYNPFLNGAIGRYAGFMSGANYHDPHSGKTVHLKGNAHYSNSNNNNNTVLFNGGDNGWGRQTWEVAAHTKDSITFLLFDRMWNGFPGINAACLTHTVTPYEWKIAFGVTPLIKAAPIDLSHTVFFNLDGFIGPVGGDHSTILNHSLHLPGAGMRFGVDEQGVATGDMLANREGGEYDFWSTNARTVGHGLRQKPELPRHCKTIGGRGCGYDETFLFSSAQQGMEQPSAVLSSVHSGITMELYADRDAVHVHTWNEPDGTLALKASQGNGQVAQLGAISLEMRDYPDAVSQPQWRDRKTMYGMDVLYTYYATYRFSVKPAS
ncbi:aldose 1-epimerase family protein [Rhypophila decipiens]